jgi:tRNA threonylcarbamoyladenosine biosynthesis protein TsaB
MRLLAIDTSTRWGGAALLDQREGTTRVVAEVGAFVEDSHAARTLPMVERLLALAGWPKSSLDAYAAVRGPGAFTGVRVALGLVRGLALATGRPCVGVGSLDAMAEAWGPAPADRVPLLDAGRGEVYGARFDAAGTPPRSVIPAWVGDAVRALDGGGDVVVLGGGAASHEARLREAGYRGVVGRPPTGVAAGAGRIALSLLADRPGAEVDFTPLYVRPSDAEIKFR